MISPPELFDLLSDDTRLRCVMLLHSKKKLCVCEISCTLNSVQPKISRHLALLRKSGLISDERRGQWVYYSLHPSLPNWVCKIINAHYENLKKIEPYSSDLKKLQSLHRDALCDKK